jgi:hypothetical protein
MPAPLAISIPRHAYPDVVSLLKLSVEEFERLAAYLETAAPQPDVEDLAQDCAQKLSLDADVLERVFTFAISIDTLKRAMDKPEDEIVELVSKTLEQSDVNGFDKSEWAERKTFLAKILRTDGVVEVMSKARELLYEFQSLLISSAVLTDVRHIYNSEATEVFGGLILHCLCLDYRENNEPRQIHLTMSDSDVDNLIKQLERSKSKAKIASSMLSDLKQTDLTPRRNT